MASMENKIVNRDIIVLQNVAPIMAEVKRLEEQRDFQHDAMYSISAHLSSMPKAKGVTHGIDDMLARLSETESKYREKISEYMAALKAAERILNSIESQQMRSFVSMAYMQNKSRSEIMEALNMTLWVYNSNRLAVEQAERMRDVVWRERFLCDDEPKG